MHIHFVGEADDGLSVSSHHAQALRGVGEEVSFAPIDGPERSALGAVDAIHLVTFEQLDTRLFRRLAAARVAGVPALRFWTGRDLLWAKHHTPTHAIAIALDKLGVVQRCRTDRMQTNLRSIGIEAEVGPLVDPCLSDRSEPHPFPTQPTALCFLPTARREFCGGRLIDEIIDALPDMRFLVLGDASTDYTRHPNVESRGFVDDVSRSIFRSTILLQPRLDGVLSRLSLEALSHGRHVVGSCEWECCRLAGSTPEYVEALRELKHSPPFNLEGRESVCHQFERRDAVEKLRVLLESMINGSFVNRRILGGWLGVAATLRRPQLLTEREFAVPTESSPDESDPAFDALLSSHNAEVEV